MHAWFAVFSTIHSRILLTECASESLYSVQNIVIHRILLIFDSSNTLVYRLGPSGHRKAGRPKLRWSDVIRKGMKEKGVKIEEVQDRRTLRLKTQGANPKYGKGQRRRERKDYTYE